MPCMPYYGLIKHFALQENEDREKEDVLLPEATVSDPCVRLQENTAINGDSRTSLRDDSASNASLLPSAPQRRNSRGCVTFSSDVIFDNAAASVQPQPQQQPQQQQQQSGRYRKTHRRSTSAGSHAVATKREIQLHHRRHRDDSSIGLKPGAPPPLSSSAHDAHSRATSRPTHVRSPSDMSLRTARSHYRTPSDISLRTLAAIRGSYATHRRTGSDYSAAAAAAAAVAAGRSGHQRSVSDAREPLLLNEIPPSSSLSSSRRDRALSNSSQLDVNSDLVPNFGTYARLENADDQSLLSAGGSCCSRL